jgi:hypothetical protein
MAASTISVFKNWWILAGSNVTVPTYIGTGNISVIGDNEVDVLGGVVTIGADTDVDIGAINNINMIATSTITMTASTVNRTLSATSVAQPIIQYGEDATGSGASGSVVINLPVAYTSASSYVAFATMEDADPAEMSVTRNSSSQIEIFWQQGSGGSHILAWNTMGY